jgi:membrane-associated phospholipid phosphatase
VPHLDHDPRDERVGAWDLTVWRTRTGRLLVAVTSRLSAVLGPHLALLALLVGSGLLVTLLTGASAEIYEEVDEGEGVAGLDRPVLDAALRLRSPAADTAVTWFTDLGGTVGMPILATLAVLAMTLAWRQWTPALLMLAATTGSVAMTVVGKSVVGRARPPLVDAVPPYETSGSFPSGHALNSVVVAGVIAYLLVRRQHRAWVRATTLTTAATFAFLMGMSRVYLGHHWLTDVLVAWTLGLAWLTVVVVVHRLLLTLHRRKRLDRGPSVRA